MKINYARKAIELSKSEAKKAEVYGSEMYKALLDAKKSFPDFTISVKSAPTNHDSYKGLNRAFMQNYIEKHDDDDHNTMKEFNILCGLDENGNKKAFAAVASYGELRMWFLNRYPELSDMQSSINVIMTRVKEEPAPNRIVYSFVPLNVQFLIAIMF